MDMQFLGLPLPVMAAFIVLVLGLALVAHLLHKLGEPRVVRSASTPASWLGQGQGPAGGTSPALTPAEPSLRPG